MDPLILATPGQSVSEVKLICYDADRQELDRINAKLGADEWVELPRETRAVSVIAIVDLDL